jgi:hypothetical protein
MSRLRGFGIACVLVCGAIAAPQAGEISGTVLDADSGKPIAHARVTAQIWVGKRVAHPDVLVALTDADGRFRFSGLPPSESEVRAEKAGYMADVRSNHARARSDDLSSPIAFHLAPLGWLTVRVVDESGSPVDGAQVAIVPRPGADAFIFNSGLSTVGRDGTLRVAQPRGTFGIEAVTPGSGTLLRARDQTFLPTYYPAASSSGLAEWVEVVPGKEVQAEVHITRIAARRIRGRLAFAGKVIQISILTGGSNDYYAMWGLPQPGDGPAFQVFGLAPGTYTLEVRACLAAACMVPAMFRKTVQVTATDIDGLVITEADRTPGQ